MLYGYFNNGNEVLVIKSINIPQNKIPRPMTKLSRYPQGKHQKTFLNLSIYINIILNTNSFRNTYFRVLLLFLTIQEQLFLKISVSRYSTY